MNKKQKESTAKLLYDLVRYSFIGIIVAGIVEKKIKCSFISDRCNIFNYILFDGTLV